MVSKRNINRSGSYILETSLCLPIFMIAVIVMTSVILLYACMENACYIMSNEMRRAAAEARTSPSAALVPVRVSESIRDSAAQIKETSVQDYGYLVTRNGIDKLIVLRIRLRLKVDNPLRLLSEAEHDVALATRGYVGKQRKNEPMSAASFESNDSEPVFIFPKSGRKYHSAGCTYVRAGYVHQPLTNSTKMRYSGCDVCESKKAGIGYVVCIFPHAGGAYHLPTCKVLDRRCIETEKRVAEKRGYAPCSKCGG